MATGLPIWVVLLIGAVYAHLEWLLGRRALAGKGKYASVLSAIAGVLGFVLRALGAGGNAPAVQIADALEKTEPGKRLDPPVKVWLPLVFVGLTLWPSCAAGLDGSRQTIANVVTSETAAIKALETFDGAYQDQIVHKGIATGNQLEAQQELDAYRTKRAQVSKAVLVAVAATHAAAATIELVAAGKAAPAKLDKALSDLMAAAVSLEQVVQAFATPDVAEGKQ